MRTHRLLLFVTFLVLGCNGSKVGTVSGTVTLDGKPLANARVSFQPQSDAAITGVGSIGKTDANGDYTLAFVDDTGPGAFVGKHRVVISAFDGDNVNPDDDRRRGPPDKVPPKYNVNSELTFEVRSGSNKADWELKSR